MTKQLGHLLDNEGSGGAHDYVNEIEVAISDFLNLDVMDPELFRQRRNSLYVLDEGALVERTELGEGHRERRRTAEGGELWGFRKKAN